MALNTVALAQHPNLQAIKEYYNSIERIDRIDRRIEGFLELSRELEDVFPGATLRNKATLERKIRNDNSLIFLHLRFKNAENFNFRENIYDFLTVETNRVDIVYFCKESKQITSLGCNLSTINTAHFMSRRRLRNTERFFVFVREKKPDVLFSSRLFFMEDVERNTNYLFMKGNEIFVFRTKTGRVYELNRFVRRFFDEERFIDAAILNEQGLVRFGN